MISGLIDRVQQTQLPEKDTDAEKMLQQGLGRNPDSLYILSQTILVQQYALDQAQKQLADLKSQLAASQQHGQSEPKHGTSFLGSIFGSHDDSDARPAPPPSPTSYNQQQTSTPPYSPVQNYSQPGYNPGGGYAPQPGFGAPPPPAGGGFLRSAMQTATGVAAGALAFQGIESLMHGFGGGGMGFGGGVGGGRPEEVINNYYGDDAREHHDDRADLSSDVDDRRDSGSFFNPGNDASSDTDQFAGSGDVDSDSSDNNTDSSDDSSFTDDGSGDLGGGDDDSNFS